MIVKKASPGTSTRSDRELRTLYARRLAIDDLIRSLEVYDRFRAKSVELRKRKTA